MAAASAGRDRKNSSRQFNVTGKTDRGGNTFCKAVEHKCSVNGSEVGNGSWAEMVCNEEGDVENEGEIGRMMHVNQSKGNKRVRNDHEERSVSEDDEIEGIQRDSPDKYTVIVRFNEKSQSDMKKINPFTLTTALANKVGEIIFAKVLNDGNLLIRCENESQVEK